MDFNDEDGLQHCLQLTLVRLAGTKASSAEIFDGLPAGLLRLMQEREIALNRESKQCLALSHLAHPKNRDEPDPLDDLRYVDCLDGFKNFEGDKLEIEQFRTYVSNHSFLKAAFKAHWAGQVPESNEDKLSDVLDASFRTALLKALESTGENTAWVRGLPEDMVAVFKQPYETWAGIRVQDFLRDMKSTREMYQKNLELFIDEIVGTFTKRFEASAEQAKARGLEAFAQAHERKVAAENTRLAAEREAAEREAAEREAAEREAAEKAQKDREKDRERQKENVRPEQVGATMANGKAKEPLKASNSNTPTNSEIERAIGTLKRVARDPIAQCREEAPAAPLDVLRKARERLPVRTRDRETHAAKNAQTTTRVNGIVEKNVEIARQKPQAGPAAEEREREGEAVQKEGEEDGEDNNVIRVRWKGMTLIDASAAVTRALADDGYTIPTVVPKRFRADALEAAQQVARKKAKTKQA